MQLLTSQVRNQKSKNKKNKVMLPNDPEIMNMKKRAKEGIPLEKETLEKLQHLAKKFNISLELLN